MKTEEKISLALALGFAGLLWVLPLWATAVTWTGWPAPEMVVAFLVTVIVPALMLGAVAYWMHHEPRSALRRRLVWMGGLCLICYWSYFAWTLTAVTRPGWFSGGNAGRNVYGLYLDRSKH
jgi:hypothetical protein